LDAGDIPEAGYPIELNYSATFGAFVMQNPATGISQTLGVVGASSNAKMSVTSASASTTVTADQIVVGTALNGVQYLLSSYSETINLSTSGAGGMDTGSAPTSGYVALYAIYGPTVGTNILATNASSAVPNVYAAGHMPSGYTASALISVWPTNASGQFIVGAMIEPRTVAMAPVVASSSAVDVTELTSLSISSIVPPNAKSIKGDMGFSWSAGAGSVGQIVIAASSTAIGNQRVQGNGVFAVNAPFSVPIITSQTTYWGVSTSGGSGTFNAGIEISEYTF
jgi:hypothetical protein